MINVGGYLFWLTVGPGGPQTSIDLNVGGISLPSKCAFSCSTISVAPPGTDYVYVPIQVTNRTDRPEPLIYVDGIGTGSGLTLVVPYREFDQFGELANSVTNCDGPFSAEVMGTFVPSDPSSYCLSLQGGASLSTALGCYQYETQSCNLDPGKTTTIWLWWSGAVQASAPVTDVRVYFVNGTSLAQIK